MWADKKQQKKETYLFFFFLFVLGKTSKTNFYLPTPLSCTKLTRHLTVSEATLKHVGVFRDMASYSYVFETLKSYRLLEGDLAAHLCMP